jgi:hypothetical protein
MRTVYVLESKLIDKKGREKKANHLGIFKDLRDVEKVKEEELKKNQNLSFHIHVSESWL